MLALADLFVVTTFENNGVTFEKNQQSQEEIVAKEIEIKMAGNNDVVIAGCLIFVLCCWDSFNNVHCFFYKCEAGTFCINVDKGIEKGTWTFTICPGVTYGGEVVLRELTRLGKWYRYEGNPPSMQLPHLQVNHRCDSDPQCFTALHWEVESLDHCSSIQYYGVNTYLKVKLPSRWNWRSYRFWYDELDQAERERITRMVMCQLH